LLDSTCGVAPAIACSDPPLMTVNNLAAGTYYVIVDGATDSSGPFTIETSGTIAPDGSCEGPLSASGAITCPASYSCAGPMGARTCRTQCSDGTDNNGDGNADFPTDPGCTSLADTIEDTVCPGPMCPVCADGIDNDLDGEIDWPMDTTCPGAGGAGEACFAGDPVDVITKQFTAGTTTGQGNDHTPICGSISSHTAPDVVWQLDVPNMQSLRLNLAGFDGAHSLLDAGCSSPPIACSDPSLMTVTNLAAGRYHVVIDGWGSGSGPYTLATTGVIAPGGSCEGPLFASGAFTCPSGQTCTAGICQ
jgi:hypothetical protein